MPTILREGNGGLMAGKTQIPKGWRMVRLGDVADVVTGSTPPRKVRDYYGEQTPWVKPSDLAASRLVSTSEEYLSEAGVAVSRLLPQNAVLVSCIGTIGEVAIAKLPLCSNQQINALIPGDATLPSFLYWVCLARSSYLQTIASKTAVPILNKSAFSSVSILLPPMAEQRAIAATLDSIDEAIEGVEGVIAAAESLRDALLHELLTRGIPGRHSEWRDAPGVGTIPAEWEVARLGDVADFQQGGTPRKSQPEYWDGDIPFVTGADLRDFRISRDNARSFLTDKGLNSGTTVICEPGDLLLATRTRVGLVGIANETMGASQDITLLTANGLADQSYLCRVLKSQAAVLQQRARGTTIQGISREDVASLPILLPPMAEQQAIAAALDGVDEAIESSRGERDALQCSKASVSDALLTGRVRAIVGANT